MYTTTVPALETSRTTVLTPKGETVLAAYKLLAALRSLSAADHAAVLELLELELADHVR